MEILFLPLAYLIGSLSSAILICKILRLPDPRTQGSGNAGATNVLRIAGKKTAIAVLILDALKGFIPVFLSNYFHLSLLWQGYVVLAVVAGHIFPLFFKFQGGKGVATFFGAILAMMWPLGVLLLIVWLIVAKLFHYSSLASMTSVILAPIFYLSFYEPLVVLPIFLTTVLIIYKHKENIARLLTHTESKIGEKK